MKKLYNYIPILMVVAAVLLSACSAKKNTAGSRFWQAFNTRYNVYYNGITHYKEQMHIIEDQFEDDYSQQLYIHPAESFANAKTTHPSSNFDRTITKMQKAIALHSIKKRPRSKGGKKSDEYKQWLKRDEYNPFIHNAWYLMGKAQYMKGDFLGASATFHYISRHFTWKPDLVTESQVWEVLSYCALGWTTEADNILAHIHLEKIKDKRVLALANLAFADYYIKSKKNKDAIPYLAVAAKKAKGSQKVRLNFLLGQLYEDNDQKDLAYAAFKKAGSSNSSTYRTKFNARIKQSAVFQGKDINSEVKSLKSMTRYDRNKEYLDQIYYAIGNLYLSRQDTTKAVDSYVLAAKKSTRNGVDKAISQLTLGGVYFAQRKYDLAQPCYAEAIPLINEDYPNYKVLKQRSDVLDELAVYSQNVTLQDSLLKLSQMPVEEQKKVIKKIIDELKKKEKEEADEAKREAYLAEQQSKGNNTTNSKSAAPTTYQINNDNSWYFYNTATKSAGKTQFQKLWGTRKLEDDWRRRNKNNFSLDAGGDEEGKENTADKQGGGGTKEGNDSTKADKAAKKHSEDPHFEEYYLKQIPKTAEEIQNSNDIIQEGLYNMGVILKDKLEDYVAAAYEFHELLRRYPDNIYRLDTYYNMYLMYMRNQKVGEAEECRQVILRDFANSKYGMAMKDPNYLENLKNMDKDQENMYADAYNNYLANNNNAVHEAYAEMMRKYPLSKIMPKFMFIDALSYVTQKNYDKFKSTLKEMLERYPQTDITPTASSIVKQLNQGRKLSGGSSNIRGMMWETRLTNDTTPQGIEKKFTPFSEGKDKPQLFIFVFPSDTVSANQLLFNVAKHNFTSFVVKNYDLEQLSFGKMGLLVVKGFANYAELAHYRTVLDKDTELDLPPQVHEVLISEANFNLLLNEGRSFQEYFQYLEEQNVKNVEGQIPNNVEDDKTTEGGAKTKRSVKGKPQPAKTAKEAPKPQGKTVAQPATEEKTNTTPADTTKAENIKPATAPAKTEAKPNTTKTATKPTTTKPTTTKEKSKTTKGKTTTTTKPQPKVEPKVEPAPVPDDPETKAPSPDDGQ